MNSLYLRDGGARDFVENESFILAEDPIITFIKLKLNSSSMSQSKASEDYWSASRTRLEHKKG